MERSLRIDFPGGSVADLLALLRKAGGGAFNLIGDQGDLATRLPAFVINDTDSAALAGALEELLRDKGLAVTTLRGNSMQSAPVYVLKRAPGAVSEPPTSWVRCYPLRSLGLEAGAEVVTGAIQTAWALDPQHDPNDLRIQFHPGTQLLLVSGSGQACMVADQVVAALAPPMKAMTPAPAP